jgi:hypothetical protein
MALLLQAIKKKSLECYLLLHMENFISISLEKLGLSFELPEKEVRKVVSQGIISGSFKGVLEGEFLVLTSRQSPLTKRLTELSSVLLDISRDD